MAPASGLCSKCSPAPTRWRHSCLWKGQLSLTAPQLHSWLQRAWALQLAVAAQLALEWALLKV